MENFDAIKILINGVDVSADVMQDPAPRVDGIGLTGPSFLDRVGGIGKFTFALDNSASNSYATLGAYTPPSATTDVMPGSVVQLYFEYDGIRRYKFYGTIDTDGIKVVPGKYGSRKVFVSCSNWFARAAKHTIELLGYQTNQTFDTAMRYVLANMHIQPQNTVFNTGQETFPTVFDISRTSTTVIGELNKLVFSEWGRAYIKGDGTAGETLYLEDNAWYTRRDADGSGDVDSGSSIPVKSSDVTSFILMTSGDQILKTDNGFIKMNETQRAAFTESDNEGMDWAYGLSVFNRVTFKTYPRTVDAAATTVLWSLAPDEYITLEAGQQISDIRGTFRDPNGGFAKVNGIEMVTPVSGTDYAMFANSDGTGTNYTSSLSIIADYTSTAEVRYTLTNNAAVTAYVTLLQARGKGIYVYDTNDKIYNNRDSQLLYDVLPVEIDMPYLNSITDLVSFGYDSTIWTGFLNRVAEPVPVVSNYTMTVNKSSKQMMAFMCLEPRDFMIIDETVTNTATFASYDIPMIISGYSFELINGTTIKWKVNLKIRGIA